MESEIIHDPMRDLKVGDYIFASTNTYSQKYTMRDGYEDYNATYQGTIIEIGSDVCSIKIKLDDGTIRYAVQYVGDSGWHTFYRLDKKISNTSIAASTSA